MGYITVKECEYLICSFRKDKAIAKSIALKNIFTIHLNEFIERKNNQMPNTIVNQQIRSENEILIKKNEITLNEDSNLKSVFYLVLASCNVNLSIEYASLIENGVTEIHEIKEYV